MSNYNGVLKFLGESIEDRGIGQIRKDLIQYITKIMSEKGIKMFAGQSAEFGGQPTWVLSSYYGPQPGYFLQVSDDDTINLVKRIFNQELEEYDDEDISNADIDAEDEAMSVVQKSLEYIGKNE